MKKGEKAIKGRWKEGNGFMGGKSKKKKGIQDSLKVVSGRKKDSLGKPIFFPLHSCITTPKKCPKKAIKKFTIGNTLKKETGKK